MLLEAGQTMRRFFYTYVAPFMIINFGNACAYLFQLLLARTLTPEDLGGFNAALSTATLLTAPAAVAPLTVLHMAHEAQLKFGPKGFSAVVVLTIKWAMTAAATVMLGSIVLAPLLFPLLKVQGTVEMANVILLLGVTLIYPFAAGWYQARGQYGVMSLILGGVPMLRLLLGAILVWALSYGLSGSLLSASLPCVIVFVIAVLGVWPHISGGAGERIPGLAADGLKFALPSAASTVLLYAFFNLDMILARALLPEAQSGYYAIAASLGRIAFLAPAAVANLLFGEMKKQQHTDGPVRARMFLKSIAGVTVLALVIGLPIAVLAEPILVLLAGPTYAVAAPVLQIACFGMSGLAVLNSVIFIGLTTESKKPLAFLALSVSGFGLFCVVTATTGRDIAVMLAVAIGAALVICTPLVYRALRIAPGPGKDGTPVAAPWATVTKGNRRE